MGDILGAGYGLGGGADALNKLFEQRIEAAHLAEQQRQSLVSEQQRQRQLEQQDAYHRLQMQQHADAQAATMQDHRDARARLLFNLTPIGGEVSGPEMQTQTAAGIPQGLFKPKPIAAPAPPPGIAAPSDSGTDQPVPGTIANSPQPMGRLYSRGATQEDITKQVEADRKAAADEAKAAAAEKKASSVTLSQAGKTARSAIETAGPLTDRVMEMIRKEAPDIETNPQKYNTPMNKLGSLAQTAKYKLGFYDETDPRQQLVSLLQPIQAGQYTRSSRSRQMLDLALKHMADPTQTLLTQYQRAKELKGIMPEMLEGIVRAEQPVDPANPLAGSYFDAARPMPSHEQGTGDSHPPIVKNGWNYEWKGDRYTAVSPVGPSRPNQAPAASAPAAGAQPSARTLLDTTRLPEMSTMPAGMTTQRDHVLPLDTARLPESSSSPLPTSAPRQLGNQVSPQGKTELQQREGGFYGEPYQDAGTGLAIGYGMHQWQGAPVTSATRATEPQANAEMDRQIKATYGPIVDGALRVPVSQPQYDALVSMAWNAPSAARRVIDKLNRGETITEQDFHVATTVHGRPNQGLVHRRDSEFATFRGTP